MSFEETLAALLDARFAPLRSDLERLAVEMQAERRRLSSPLDGEVLTVAEGAKEAKVSTKTIRAACAAGGISAHKPAGCSEWRFTRAALLAWLRPTAPAPSGGPRSLDSDAGPRQVVEKLLRGSR